MPYYNDDNLTPEEEAMLMRLRPPGETVSPQPTPPPFGETVSPRGIDPRVVNYLRQTRTGPDYGALAQIQSGALQGIAGGFAQMGTVHGKTPDASPYQHASQQMAKGVGMMEDKIDPRVAQYLASRYQQPQEKPAPWKAVGKTPDGRIIYSDGTNERVGENRSYIPKPQQKMPSKETKPKPTQATTATELKQKGNYEMGVLAEKQYLDATTGPGAWDPTKQYQFINTSSSPLLQRFKDPKAQQAFNAMDAWVETYLRDATGAVIGPSERPSYYGIYFPREGDTPETVQQKKALRDQKMRSAGQAGRVPEDQLNTALGGQEKKPLTPKEQAELEELRKKKSQKGK
jgi:hypothetical protein